MVMGPVLLDGPADEFVVVLAAGADVHIEHVGLPVVYLVLVEHGVLGIHHAADLRAIGDALGVVAGADATDEHHRLGHLAVGRPP